MKINTGIGRENLIEQIIHITDNPMEVYSELSLYELAVELKITKMQAGLV